MPQPDITALSARNQLLTIFVALCLLDATLIFLSKDLWTVGRLLFTIALMYFVMQGRKWAKWLMVGLCSLAIALLLALVIALSTKLSVVLLIGSLILAVLYAIVAFYLVKNKPLNRYFSHKRQASLQVE